MVRGRKSACGSGRKTDAEQVLSKLLRHRRGHRDDWPIHLPKFLRSPDWITPLVP